MRKGRSIYVLAAGAMLALAACGGKEEGEGGSAMTPTDSAGMASQGAPIDPNAGTAPAAGVDGGSGTADGTVNTTTGPAATGTATTP